MSKDIENKVVSMEFDNSKFEKPAKESISTLDKLKEALHFKNVSKGFETMQQGIKSVTFAPIEKGIDSVYAKFTFMERFTIQLYDRLANKIINTGRMIASETFTRPISTGKAEYEEKMGAVQTIMASSKKSLAEVNEILAELNKYADDTIYSFRDMTTSIGKFTNAGVDLKDAVAAIKGISNEAALSGANANEASRAMYNFAQALSSGAVKLIDWKSIENANMATKEFKQELIDTAVAQGKLTKQADGYYRTLNGKTFNATARFNDALQDQWMTSDVLIKTLGRYADATTDIGKRASAAATEVKTFSMLIDTLKEALQSGWSESWENIIGDFEQAKKLWTSVSNVIGGLIGRMADARNTMLKFWSQFGGRTALLQGISNAWKALTSILGAVRDAFRAVFPPMTGQRLIDLTKRFEAFTAKLRPTQPTILRIRDAFKGFFSIIGIGVDALKAFYRIFAPLVGKAFSFLSREVLKSSAGLGQWLFNLRRSIQEGKLFEKLFSSVAVVFKALGHAFKAVYQYIAGVITAFNTGGFTAGLKRIKDGFVDLMGSLWKTVKRYNPLQAIKNLGVKIADAISKWPVGQAVVKFVTSIKNGIVNSPVWKLCKDIVLGFVHAIQAIINKFRNVDTSATGEFTNNVKKGFGPLEAIGKFFSTIWKGILAIWSVIGPALKAIGKNIATAFGTLFNSIKGVINRSDLGDAGVFAAGGGFGALMIAMANFTLNLSKTVKNAGGAVRGMRKLIDGVVGLLKGLKFEAYARSIKDIAVSIALLAGSMFVLAALPADAITRATAAIMLLFKGLTQAMTAFSSIKFVADGTKGGALGLLSIGAQMMLMAGAITILVANIAILALLPYGALVKGIAMLVLVLRALSKEAIKMTTKGGQGKVATALIALAVTLHLLAVPIALLALIGGVNFRALMLAVGGVIAIVSVMSECYIKMAEASAKADMKRGPGLGRAIVGLGAGIVAIAVAIGGLGIIAAVFKMTHTSSALERAAKIILKVTMALGAIVIAMVALMGVIQKFNKVGDITRTTNTFKNGKSVMSTETLKVGEKSRGIMGPVIGALLGIGAAMVMLSAAVAIIAISTRGLTDGRFEDVMNSVRLLVFVMGGFAVLIALVNKASNRIGDMGNATLSVSLFPSMAAYIFAASAFVMAVAAAAKVLHSVDNRDITWALGIIAGVLIAVAGLSAVSAMFPKFAEGFTRIAQAFRIFGMAAMFLGIGVGVVIAALALLNKSTGNSIESFADKLDSLVVTLNKRKDSIVNAVALMVQIVIESIATGAAKAFLTVVDEIIKILNDLFDRIIFEGPKLLDKLWTSIVVILKSITSRAPEVTEELVKALVAVIKGLAAAIDRHSTEIIEAINGALEAILKVVIGTIARIFGVSKDKIEKFTNDILPHAKRATVILLGIFALSKLKKASDAVLSLLSSFASALAKLPNKFAMAFKGFSFETSTKQVMRAKDYFKTAEELQKWISEKKGRSAGSFISAEVTTLHTVPGLLDNIKGKASSLFGKITGFVKAHPVLLAVTAIGLALSAVLRYATKGMTVIQQADRETTDIANRMRQREEEYQRLVAQRKEAMDGATAGFDRYAEYARKLNAEIISVDGTIIEGQEQQFEWYKQQLAGVVELKIGEDGRVKIIDEQNEALDYQATALDKILKKQRQQRQLEAVQQDYDNALKKRDELNVQYVTAKEKLEAYGSQIASTKTELGMLDRYFKDQTIDNVLYKYEQYRQLIGSLGQAGAIKKVLGGVLTSYDDDDLSMQAAIQTFTTIGESLRGQQQTMADEVDLLGRSVSRNESFMRAYAEAEKKVAAGAEDADSALRILASNPIFADTLVDTDWTKRYATLQIESEEAIKKLASAVAVTPWKHMSSSMRSEYMDTINVTFDQLEKAGYFKAGELGRWLEKGLEDGLNGSQLTSYMTKFMGNNVVNPAFKAVDSNSPSKVFMQLGDYCMQGIMLGVSKDQNKVNKAFEGAAIAATSAYNDALSKPSSSFAWAPLIDTTGIQNGTAAIQRQFGTLHSTIPTSMTSKLAASVDTSSINMDNSRIVDSLGILQEQFAELRDVMTNMQVVMDSGQLVGALAPGMDAELGRRVVRKERGV